jgi:hypothetical protein
MVANMPATSIFLLPCASSLPGLAAAAACARAGLDVQWPHQPVAHS